MWASLVLVPSILFGATLEHFRAARAHVPTLRPGVLGLGGVLGVVATGISAGFFVAANASADVQLTRYQRVPGAPEVTWPFLADPVQISQWSPWLRDVSVPEGGGVASVGSRYGVSLQVDSQNLETSMVLTAFENGHRIGWALELPEGVRVHDVREEVQLEPADGDTRISYTLRYRVLGVPARVVHLAAMAGFFKAVADESISGLTAFCTQ